jgi:hypothetical protein
VRVRARRRGRSDFLSNALAVTPSRPPPSRGRC